MLIYHNVPAYHDYSALSRLCWGTVFSTTLSWLHKNCGPEHRHRDSVTLALQTLFTEQHKWGECPHKPEGTLGTGEWVQSECFEQTQKTKNKWSKSGKYLNRDSIEEPLLCITRDTEQNIYWDHCWCFSSLALCEHTPECQTFYFYRVAHTCWWPVN